MHSFRLRSRAGAFLSLVVLAAAGCGDHSNSRYIPSENAARGALETALNAWQNGQAGPGPIPDSKPPVTAVDSRWQAGERLQSFEVVSEDPNPGGPPAFTVDLKMQAPAASKKVKYYVVGLDPLWVYREDDYQQPAGM